VFDEGVKDKRLLAVEPEFARTLRAAARRESTLGPILRQAWEGAYRLAAMTKQPFSALNAHIARIAHCTRAEFGALLNETDISGGTFNRFLFICCKRQRSLPFGGHVDDAALERIGRKLAGCLDAARRFAGEFGFTREAEEAWPSVYSRLQADEAAPGILGELLARGTAQVRRLSMLFAILDGQQEVDVRHVEAAEEIWRFSRQSVRYVFGTSTGNRVADRIIGELRENEEKGLSRNDIRNLFDRHVSSTELDAALTLLQELHLAYRKRVPTSGRPREVWFPRGGA
jgi:hypothetical protein